MQKGLSEERERNIPERKAGYDYLIVTVNFKPGKKFGLGIKNVYRNIYVIKVEENSIVSGCFNIADRILDVDGTAVIDNVNCKNLLVKGLKERKMATLLIERATSAEAIKEATGEMNEERIQSVMVPPDVRDIMKKMEMRMNEKKQVPLESALSKNNGEKKGDRKACVLEDGHKSVMIRMDNEENRDKLKKVVKKDDLASSPDAPSVSK